MPELIISVLPTLLPTYVRPIFCIPQFACYAGEQLTPVRCLRQVYKTGRILSKCLRYGAVDAEAEEIMEKLRRATCLADYESWSTRLDVIQGHEDWKEEKESIEREYDPDTVQRHIDEMLHALTTRDREEMRVALRASASRTMGGMDLLRLYKHTWFDTKHRINDYIHTVRGTIEAYVALLEESGTPASEIDKGINALEHYYQLHGASAICLSGGAVVGMKHIGVVKCLWESYLLPGIICGTSAGSIVASIVGCSTDEEVKHVLEHFPSFQLQCFDSSTNLPMYILNRASEYWKTGHFFDPQYLDKMMSMWIRDLTFEEAYKKTGRILNITVSRHEDARPIILNHITAPDVVVRTAVCASCALPKLFPPATILEKVGESEGLRPWNNEREERYVDGSIGGDIPLELMKEMWNAKFFIVSQVNPHVRWVLRQEEKFAGRPITASQPEVNQLERIAAWAFNLTVDGIRSWDNMPVVSKFALWQWRTILTQNYTGDVNIHPAIGWWDWLSLMRNPTKSYVTKSIKEGEQATWPKMPRIKNSLATEEALQRGIKELNQRAVRDRVLSETERMGSTDQSARSTATQPDFLRRRSIEIIRRPDLRRSSTDEGDSRRREMGAMMMRRNKSEPDLVSMLIMSPPDGPRPLSPRPAPPLQAGIRGPLAMTPVSVLPNGIEA